MLQLRRGLRSWLAGRGADFAGKALLLCYFSAVFTKTALRSVHLLAHPPAEFQLDWWLAMSSRLALLSSTAFMAVLTLRRLAPTRTAQGFGPSLSAVAGTWLFGLIALVEPSRTLPQAAVVCGLVMTVLGCALTIYVLSWLGRAFSIAARATRLVTGGPYRLVRHPLYLAEEVTILGVVLLNFSWQAVVLCGLQWALQLRRMRIEEQLLTDSFPEYEAYALCTPRLVPRWTWAHAASNRSGRGAGC